MSLPLSALWRYGIVGRYFAKKYTMRSVNAVKKGGLGMNDVMSKFAEKLNKFYMGRLYPTVVCALVLLGFIFSKEQIFIPIIVLMACLAFWVCRSVRPLVTPLCTFIYSLSNNNAIFGEDASNYYFTGWRIVALVLLAIFAAASIVAFVARSGIISKMIIKKTPLLFPLILLSVSFLCCGLLSDKWVIIDLLYGSFQVLSFLVVYVLFYHGFGDDEGAVELGDYFSYVTLLMSLVLITEMVWLYTSGDGVISSEGEIVKALIVFGWGSCNNAGVYLAMLIPMNFYGAKRSRFPIVYFLAAAATYCAAVLTLSRNALLCATLVYVCCLVGFSLLGEGKRRRFFAYGALAITLCVAVVYVVYREPLLLALHSYAEQGASDSGRFEIWRKSILAFLENPIFGNGFYQELETGTMKASFIPAMSHNTVFQLLSGMGIVGFLSYVIYRISSLRAFFVRPELLKTMLGLSMLVLLFESMFDNFIFQIHPVFYYSIAMAIAYRRHNEELVWRPLIKAEEIKLELRR